MKNIITALAAASVLLFTGCFVDSDTATVRINLGNIPVAKVEKKSLIDRFLMIFAKEAVAQEVPSGIISITVTVSGPGMNTLSVTKEAPFESSIELSVPAGNNRLIEIRALQDIRDYEVEDESTDSYGFTTTVDLSAGEIKQIEASMEAIPYIYEAENDTEYAYIRFYFRGSEIIGYEFEIQYSETINGTYEVITDVEPGESDPGGDYKSFYYEISNSSYPADPFNGFIRIKIVNENNTSLYSIPKQITEPI